MLRIGETIDRYRVEALIGQGGMATVYKARHTHLDSVHAIKVLFITAPMIRERLLREGRVQASIRHSNIVSVTDVLEVLGAPALVMEYVDGPALDAWLLETRPDLDEALEVFSGIVRGVKEAHRKNVVHRDLKPANVLLAPSSDGLLPKVTDFGLVKSIAQERGHTMTGMALGTPEYMAPEQIRDASNVDQRADLWGLGCILYELICHRRAFSGPDKMAIFNAIVAGTYAPPRKYVADLPRNVTEAIARLLETDREDRLPSCDALQELLYIKTPESRSTPQSTRPQKRSPGAAPNALVREPPPIRRSRVPTLQVEESPAAPAALGFAEVPTAQQVAERNAMPASLLPSRASRRATAEFEFDDRPSWRFPAAVALLLVAIVALTVVLAMTRADREGPSLADIMQDQQAEEEASP